MINRLMYTKTSSSTLYPDLTIYIYEHIPEVSALKMQCHLIAVVKGPE